MAQSATYEIPEEDLTDSMKALGSEVQLTTFKTNLQDGLSQDHLCQQEMRKLGIVCVGSCNFWDKIVYIRHFFKEKPSVSDSNCILGVETIEKDITWDKEKAAIVCMKDDISNKQNSSQSATEEKQNEPSSNRNKIPLQIHISVLGQRLPDRLAKVYLSRRDSKVGIIGAVVFCAASNTTLHSAIEWNNVVQDGLQPYKNIPIVLVVENMNESVKWIGEGNFVEDQEAMDEYCTKNGFSSWMEMVDSDWKLGERNVFGRAVETILKHEMCGKKDSTK